MPQNREKVKLPRESEGHKDERCRCAKCTKKEGKKGENGTKVDSILTKRENFYMISTKAILGLHFAGLYTSY